jgi:enoyl-CoA hydratase/carnithine racemase
MSCADLLTCVFENLTYEVKNHIAYIAINRPKVLNALNAPTLAEIRKAFESVRTDPAIRAAILTGSGEKSFAAGADISEFIPLAAAEGQAKSVDAQAVFALIENCGKPVIAAVNGYALGGGCEMAMACSIRIASEKAHFGQPEIKLGIIPGFGGTQRLPRLVGRGVALQMILTGEMISAVDALRIGLVNEVVASADLLKRAEEIACKIIGNGPIAARLGLEAVNRGLEMPLEQGLAHEASLFGLAFATKDKTEGTKAFMEKRAAQFTGE